MRRCTPLNAAAMWKLSGESDPDPQRYLRNTHTDRQTDRQTEIPCFYREMALETALEDNPVVSMPTVHSFKKGIFGVLLCDITTHFKVAYYCECMHNCALIMLFN